ncbi:MAG TPA: FkbM family methyltransferase [Puia sp.]|jgi:FkbM family methyltransferase|nr:FkbM family methyltransferase [Puia sp.]
MFFIKRIIESIKILFSKDTILDIPINRIIKITGESNIKTFVQIGSNDGMKNDPLYSYIRKNAWKGILVEPDKTNFNKLRNNYSQVTGLIFENVGIGPEKGEMLFYRIKDIRENEPGWYDQVGSFDKETFIKNIEHGKELDKRIFVESLPVITFYDLLQKYNFQEIDLLHIDTEGFDYKILRSIDFSKYNIRVVIFEGEWMTRIELKEIIQYLRKYNYHIYRCGIDYAGVKQ